jgi:hypothetical protein
MDQDETRPTCRQCQKNGKQCSGYDHQLTFVNINSNAPTKQVSSREPRQKSRNQPMMVLKTSNIEISFPRELDLSAFEEDIMFSNLFANYVHRDVKMPYLDLSAQAKLGTTSFIAARALATQYFSQQHHEPRFSVKASAQYGQAMRLLRNDIARLGGPGDGSAVITVLVLVMYDVSTF